MYNRNQGGHTPKVSSFLTQITSASGIPAEQAEFEMDLEIGSAPQGPGFQMDIDTGKYQYFCFMLCYIQSYFFCSFSTNRIAIYHF